MDVKETKTPYDALIDIFEPKMNSETISKVFKEMKKYFKKDEILQEEFAGDLKPYKHLNESINKFYEGGL